MHKIRITAAVSALALTLGLASLADARRSRQVRFVESGGKLTSEKTVEGRISGHFGRGTYISYIGYDNAGNPKDTTTMKLKGGTITFKENGRLRGKNVTTRWRITRGTGKHKGITGSGTATGNITKLVFTYKGTVRY